ncbi:MAG: VPLPA-CTERM sorting domain-containing protein [Pseudomonadota bacterium]
MFRLIALTGGLAVASVDATGVQAASFDFEEIATTEFLFNSFSDASINNNDDLAFIGRSALVANSSAVLVSQGNGDGTIVYETTDGGPVASFSRPPSINDNGIVAYSGRTDDNRSIVGIDDGGPGFLTYDSIPGSPVNRFSSVDINDSNQVVVIVTDGLTETVRVYDTQPFDTLDLFNPAQSTLRSSGAPGISETGLVAYEITDFGDVVSGARRQSIDMPNVSSVDFEASSTGITFNNLGMADNGAIAYVRTDGSEATVVLFDQTQGLTDGVTTDIATFDGSVERIFSGVSINDSEEIAFSTIDDNGIFDTLYLWSGGTLFPILSNGDEIDGLEVRNAFVSNQSLSNTGTLGLRIDLFDADEGEGYQAIYRARRIDDMNTPTPIPLPATGVLLLAGLSALRLARRKA